MRPVLGTIATIGLLALSAYLLKKGLVAYGEIDDPYDYFLHGGELSFGDLTGTLVASNLSLGNMIFVCAIWGYFFGWEGTLWVAICLTLFIVGYVFFASKFRRYVEDKDNSGTIHEFIVQPYRSEGKGTTESRAIRRAASWATIIALALALVLEVHLVGFLLQRTLDVPIVVGVGIFTVLIGGYVTLGGYRTVVITDKAQAYTMFAAFIAISLFLFFVSGWSIPSLGSGEAARSFSDPGWANKTGISFIGAAWLLVTMDTWQRNCASRSLETTVKGAVAGGLILVGSVVLFAIIGMYVKAGLEPVLAEEMASQLSGGYYALADLVLYGPQGSVLENVLVGVFVLGLLMAGISTADTFLMVVAHSGTFDIKYSHRRHPFREDQATEDTGGENQDPSHRGSSVGFARQATIWLSIGVVLIWLLLSGLNLLGDPLTLFFILYGAQFALLPGVLASSYSYRFRGMSLRHGMLTGVVFAVVFGGTMMVLMQRSPGMEIIGLAPSEWSVLTPLLTSLIASLVAFLTGGLPQPVHIR